MSNLLCYFIFFFKQKTAYEMRISDWSSDVCSSDLEVVLDHENPQSVQASRSSRHGSAFRYASSARARQRRRIWVWQPWDGVEVPARRHPLRMNRPPLLRTGCGTAATRSCRPPPGVVQLGRAPCRERGVPYGEIPWV